MIGSPSNIFVRAKGWPHDPPFTPQHHHRHHLRPCIPVPHGAGHGDWEWVVTDIDIEQIAYGLLQDAKLLSVARPDQLEKCKEWLGEAERELAAARAKLERWAA